MTTANRSVSKFENDITKIVLAIRERINAPGYAYQMIAEKLNQKSYSNNLSFLSEILKNVDVYFRQDSELFYMAVARPNWDQAPDWANFLTGSKDGFWCWHEKKPTFRAFNMFNPVARMKSIDTGLSNAMWGGEIFERPSKVDE